MSKELFEHLREIEIQAQLSDELFMQIPSDIRQQMTIKRIDQPNFRPIYEQDITWKQLHKNVVEAVKARSEREDEIRAMHK